MSKADKTLAKLLSSQQDENIAFADLCHLLTKLGYIMRQKGSHHFFSKAGSPAINVQPDGSKAKGYQVKQIRAILSVQP